MARASGRRAPQRLSAFCCVLVQRPLAMHAVSFKEKAQHSAPWDLGMEQFY